MKRFFYRLLLVMTLAVPVMAVTSCSEDAPTYTNTPQDFLDKDLGKDYGDWGWETEQAEDLSDKFDVQIRVISDTQITISNFHNLGMAMSVDVDNVSKTIKFSGKLSSDYEIQAGTGTITNGYQQMNISYDIVDLNEETTEHVKAKLIKNNVLSKKAVAEN